MTTDLRRGLIRLDVEMVEWDVLRPNVERLRRFLRLLCDNVLCCSCRGKSSRSNYLTLPRVIDSGGVCVSIADAPLACVEVDSDLVPVKISLLGDCRVGKTSFMMKYAGGAEKDEEFVEERRGLQIEGMNRMDKISYVRGARIIHSIWDVAGDHRFLYHMPIACKDSSAILYMFDLTNRWTLNNVIGWYRQSMKWNKTAIPVLIGTKFDDFVKLPMEMQRAVVKQARAFARAMNATLFFSSATHNINVNKIFKFITAKTFNLPWTVERNLKLGEPIIDF